MSFDDALFEARERFSEVLQLLNYLEVGENIRDGSASTPEKAMKGLFLVALYGAFERSANSVVEQAIAEISSHQIPSNNCMPALLSVFHHSHVQSIRGCSKDNLFEKSMALFNSAASENPIVLQNNPLAEILQNVDGSTLKNIASYFCLQNYEINSSSMGRLNNLRERRNAVAHGRESAATAGERFSLDELRRLYSIVDAEMTRFIVSLRFHCENKHYRAVVA